MSKLVNVGFNNFINTNKIISVIDYDSAPARRVVKNAKESMMLTDSTSGNKTMSVIIMDGQHVIISAIKPETITKRINEI